MHENVQYKIEHIFVLFYAGYGINVTGVNGREIIILFSICRHAHSCTFISVIELPRIPPYCPNINPFSIQGILRFALLFRNYIFWQLRKSSGFFLVKSFLTQIFIHQHFSFYFSLTPANLYSFFYPHFFQSFCHITHTPDSFLLFPENFLITLISCHDLQKLQHFIHMPDLCWIIRYIILIFSFLGKKSDRLLCVFLLPDITFRYHGKEPAKNSELFHLFPSRSSLLHLPFPEHPRNMLTYMNDACTDRHS